MAEQYGTLELGSDQMQEFTTPSVVGKVKGSREKSTILAFFQW